MKKIEDKIFNLIEESSGDLNKELNLPKILTRGSYEEIDMEKIMQKMDKIIDKINIDQKYYSELNNQISKI